MLVYIGTKFGQNRFSSLGAMACEYGRTDGRTDGQTDGRTDGQTDSMGSYFDLNMFPVLEHKKYVHEIMPVTFSFLFLSWLYSSFVLSLT